MSVFDAIMYDNQKQILDDEKMLLFINMEMESTYAAPIEKLSAKQIDWDESTGNSDYAFPQGYNQVINR